MTNAASMPRLRCLCVLLLFVTVSSAWGVDPSRPVSGYIRNHFTDEDGLPSSNIVDQMVQSRDGFLLLRTGGTLARFDGRHFYVFQLGPIKTMALAEDGDLWISTADDLK